jgi:arabinose-5-phosphate isomerase
MDEERSTRSETAERACGLALEVGRQVVMAEGAAVLSLAEKLGPEFAEMVERIYTCKGRVIVTGVGKSGIIAEKIAATLTSTGTPAFYIHPGDAAHGDIGIVGTGDVVVFVSKSGETPELVQLLPVLKRLGVTLFTISARKDSPLARASDCTINTGAAAEACPFDLVPTTSTTCALVIGDAMAIALLRMKGFTKEDFAFVHPGGVLGHMLNLRVGDVMHAGDEMPAVSQDVSMKDAILEIMAKRLGMTTVLDPQGKLAGVVTDGDFKRILLKAPDIFKVKVSDVMTRNPRTVGKEELVVTAVKKMEENKPFPITSLVVVGPSGKPDGVVHLHDCLRVR